MFLKRGHMIAHFKHIFMGIEQMQMEYKVIRRLEESEGKERGRHSSLAAFNKSC